MITQNIDELHQRAGWREVLEIHGNLREATCISCHRSDAAGELLMAFLASGQVPRCRACGGVMKPNVVLFGEQLPEKAVEASLRHLRRADLLLVAESSLEVTPVAGYPLRVYRRGGRIIVVNLTQPALTTRRMWSYMATCRRCCQASHVHVRRGSWKIKTRVPRLNRDL